MYDKHKADNTNMKRTKDNLKRTQNTKMPLLLLEVPSGNQVDGLPLLVVADIWHDVLPAT